MLRARREGRQFFEPNFGQELARYRLVGLKLNCPLRKCF